MRATEHSITRRRATGTAVLASLAVCALPLGAARPKTVLATINYVATALSGDTAIDAMTPFDKSFANYAKLRDYFVGLTDSAQLVNEVDLVDEQDSGTHSEVTVNWTLTLTNRNTPQTERRTGEIHVRLARENGKWKIIDFSPIEFFNPQARQRSR